MKGEIRSRTCHTDKSVLHTGNVLPMPGGPDSSAAFHGPCFPPNDLPTAPGMLNLASHVRSHPASLLAQSWLPNICFVLSGLCLSTHSNPFEADAFGGGPAGPCSDLRFAAAGEAGAGGGGLLEAYGFDLILRAA